MIYRFEYRIISTKCFHDLRIQAISRDIRACRLSTYDSKWRVLCILLSHPEAWLALEGHDDDERTCLLYKALKSLHGIIHESCSSRCHSALFETWQGLAFRWSGMDRNILCEVWIFFQSCRHWYSLLTTSLFSLLWTCKGHVFYLRVICCRSSGSQCDVWRPWLFFLCLLKNWQLFRFLIREHQVVVHVCCHHMIERMVCVSL